MPHIGASTSEAEVNCAVMASEQVVDFLKNGNIINSVNFPRIRLSRSTDHRLIVINKNEPGMIGKIAEFIANKKLNISDMVNKSRDDIAINLIDLDSEPPKELIDVNAMLGAGSPEHPDGDNAFSPDGIIMNHAYSILDIQEY